MKKLTTISYQAFDGSIFTSEKECKEYESNVYSQIRSKFLNTGSCVFMTDDNRFLYVYITDGYAAEALTVLFSYKKLIDVDENAPINTKSLQLRTLHLFVSDDGGMYYKYVGQVDTILNQFQKKIHRMTYYLNSYKDYIINEENNFSLTDIEIEMGV